MAKKTGNKGSQSNYLKLIGDSFVNIQNLDRVSNKFQKSDHWRNTGSQWNGKLPKSK